MLEKGKKEKHEEQVQFAAYRQFCDDTSTKKSRAIKVAGETVEMLTADIGRSDGFPLTGYFVPGCGSARMPEFLWRRL